MKINLRNKVGEDVQLRLSQGQRKEQIYNELKERYPAASVERSLAQWPYPKDKEQNKYFNFTLLIIALFFAALTVLQLIGLRSSISGNQLAGGVLTLLIQIYIIYGLKNFNLIAYLLVILFGVRTIIGAVGTGSFTPNIMIMFALGATALILALIQKKRLFPKVSFLMRHKKDSNGNIIF